MQYIKFRTSGSSLSKNDKTPIISGSINFYGIEIEFDDFWNNLPGTKEVQFCKNRNRVKRDLENGKCIIPNDFIEDKHSFDMRVVSGDRFATPWIPVVLTEGGPLFQDNPEEDLPEDLTYVKTPKGDQAISQLRVGENGLEYSVNGIDWESAINGIPDVPKTIEDMEYLRKRGDWVPIEKGQAIADLTGSPTMTDFNNLLAQLRAAGVISE